MNELPRALSDTLGSCAAGGTVTPVTGGDSHRTVRVRCGDRNWFVKLGAAADLPVLEAESNGLHALDRSGCVAVPKPHSTGTDGEAAWLVTDWERLEARGDAEALGAGLACLHRSRGERHGWERDNFIGPTPQHNAPLADWAEFWWRRRLAPQLALARSRGHGQALDPLQDPLERSCRKLLDHEPPPSLLHGDLWAGNHGYRPDGTPVIFDPATSHGDRETDLAMMHLFGSFDPAVFRAYDACWPLTDKHEIRRPCYQLYHLLNHLNLFGAGWLPRVKETARRLLRSVGID